MPEIVLIDELAKTPFVHEYFHYIKGSPTDYEILKKLELKNLEQS
jgi:voltage-gated potassium channel